MAPFNNKEASQNVKLYLGRTAAFSGLRSSGLTSFLLNHLARRSGLYCDHSVTRADVRLSVGIIKWETIRATSGDAIVELKSVLRH